MSNVRERPKRTIKRPTYLGYEYLMDSKKLDDDIEILEESSNVPCQPSHIFDKTAIKNFQLPNLSDEDLEILELPPQTPPSSILTPQNGTAPCYYPHLVGTANLFDSFANHPTHVNHDMTDDVVRYVNQTNDVTSNPYHQLVAENAENAFTTPPAPQPVNTPSWPPETDPYAGTGPDVGVSYPTPSVLFVNPGYVSSRDDQSPSVASCSPTSSLSSNGFASPEETEVGIQQNGVLLVNPPDSSSSPNTNDPSAAGTTLGGGVKSTTGVNRRSGRTSKLATTIKHVSSTTGRKKKKRDPNEPQKPVSAYALFFRDTQAAIKGQNATATFGEVSKIVAAMWDSLESPRKEFYKKKTEAAKKDYTKKLSEYRAKMAAKNKAGASRTAPSAVTSRVTSIDVDGDVIDAPDDDEDDRAAHDERISAEAAYIESFNAVPVPGTGMTLVPVPGTGTEVVPEPSLTCPRSGCSRRAVPNPQWDDRYCSNECVVQHCKDMFNAWVSARQSPPVLDNSLPVQRASVV